MLIIDLCHYRKINVLNILGRTFEILSFIKLIFYKINDTMRDSK